MGVTLIPSILTRGLFRALFAFLLISFRSRSALQLEIVALRHQLGVLHRSVKPPKLTASDRLLWVWLSEIWTHWRSAMIIVKPASVIAWHRKRFRLFSTCKVRHGRSGRPAVPEETGKLIRKMSRENPLWEAPRIHGELLKLGIDIGETSVSKYMVRHHLPPSQTWKTFVTNHVKNLVSVDFFMVSAGTNPTAGSAPGAVTVGGRQPGDRSRAGVAESELKLGRNL